MGPYVLTSEELKLQNELMAKADAIVDEEEKLAKAAEIEVINDACDADDKKKKNWHRLFGKDRRSEKSYKRVFLVALNIAVLMLCGSIAGSNILALYPYAITANDEVVCYVDNKESGTEAVQEAVQELAKDDSNVVLFSTGDDFNIKRSYAATKSKTDVKSSEEAAECIAEAIDKNPEKFPKIAVASTRKEKRTFTPDPNYIKDDDAFAGSTVVKSESEDGEVEVTIDYVTVNGEVIKEKEVNEKVLSEGKAAVIEKGTLGLPEGENWQTYEGDPVYRDGKELVKTAQSYIGKVQYKKGGTSLKTGVDCVGFVQAIYGLYGVKLSPYLGREGIAVSYSNAQPGDILIFASHVALYIGDGKLVHAANPSADVCIDNVRSVGKVQEVRRIITR